MMVLPRVHTDVLSEIIADFISSHLKLVRNECVSQLKSCSSSEDLQCEYAERNLLSISTWVAPGS